MKRYEEDEWLRNHDMPHENVMDEYGIEFEDLSESIQSEIRQFDLEYEKALSDGYIDEREEHKLIIISYKIALRIKREHLPEQGGNMNGAIGLLAGIGITIAAIFGINKLSQS